MSRSPRVGIHAGRVGHPSLCRPARLEYPVPEASQVRSETKIGGSQVLSGPKIILEYVSIVRYRQRFMSGVRDYNRSFCPNTTGYEKFRPDLAGSVGLTRTNLSPLPHDSHSRESDRYETGRRNRKRRDIGDITRDTERTEVRLWRWK